MQSFTIKKPISFSGVGLHSGVNSNITLKPSKVNTGIYFNRIDKDKIILAQWNNVISTKFSTNIGKDDVEVKTVEHLLSALAGLHINNCEISIDNIEVPILDGSSKIFVEEIQKVGVFVDKEIGFILDKIKTHQLGAIQLHGSESVEFCDALRHAELVSASIYERLMCITFITMDRWTHI